MYFECVFETFYNYFYLRVSHMNSSGAVGNILVFTFVNLRDNTEHTENRKYSMEVLEVAVVVAVVVVVVVFKLHELYILSYI